MKKENRDPRVKKARNRRNPDFSRDPAGFFAKFAHRANRRRRHMGVRGKRPSNYWVATIGWRTNV